MKFLYFTAVILVLSLSSIKCAEAKMDCDTQQSIAESIMYLRQFQEPQDELMDKFNETYFKVMVIGAFQVPLSDSKEDKTKAVEAYALNWYNACLKINERQY